MSNPETGNEIPTQDKQKSLGFFAVMGSVFAAMFGVRGNKYRERDFTQGKLWHFILGGVLATGLFIFFVIMLVRLVL